MNLAPLPPQLPTTRAALQRVATHVIGRRRHDLCGRFGLRAMPGGFGSPACGPDHEVVRVSGHHLVVEKTGGSATARFSDLRSASLADAARLVDVDLGADFSAGHDTPALGDVDAPLAVDPDAAAALADWYRLGWAVLDRVVADLPPDAAPTVIQLWPEHFDAACDVDVGQRGRTNLGASPGDLPDGEPYLYVGPWGADRPGDAVYWNAAFGAVLSYSALVRAPDAVEAGVAFVRRGIHLLGQP